MSTEDDLRATILAANKHSRTPGKIWVGPSFISRYSTEIENKPMTEQEAVVWLNEFGVFDEHMGLWMLENK